MLPERKASPLSPQRVLASAVVSTHVDTYGSVPTSWGQSLNGECLSCGVTGSVWKVSRVAARSFTAWSQQPHMLRTGAGEGWCRFCGLLVSASELRREWWHVTSAPRVEQLSALSLQAVLSSPVLQSDAVTAGPTGRQNLLLRMRWGCVATMWGVWPWGDREVGMFQAVLLARQHHATQRELNAEAPPVRLLLEGDAVDWFQVWQRLRAWRNTPQLTLASRVSS